MTSKVGIILLNWNGWRDTIECLESIFKLDYPTFSVYVVDNASSDQSMEHLREWVVDRSDVLHTVADSSLTSSNFNITFKRPEFQSCNVKFISSEINGGFAAGNNIGIRAALASDCDFVWLLNNDTVVEPSTLSAMVSKISSDIGFGICGSVLRYYDQREIVQAYGGVHFSYARALGKQIGQGSAANSEALLSVKDEDITYVSGASMLLRRDFILDVGLMEEGYFLYFEEIDWAERARGSWKMAISRDSVVFHKEGASIGTSSRMRRSLLSQYYLSRNLIQFYAKHRPMLLPIALARLVREFITHLYHGDKQLAWITLRALVHACIGQKGCSY